MSNEAKNVDDILIPREQAILNNEQTPVQAASDIQKLEDNSEKKTEIAEKNENLDEKSQELDRKIEENEKNNEKNENISENIEKNEENSENPIDEYGNPVAKPKMYSEDEVQRMIRERLARGKHAQDQSSQQIKEEAKSFTADPNSEESWETQLEDFVERTIQKREQKATQQQWQAAELERQSQFESKFTEGMNKYEDFRSVVAGKPITDSMMLATRNLENPAAFVYGAAKIFPQELERIAKIADPYAQAAEVGRLHEKMIKNKAMISKAAKPIEEPKGDIPIRDPMHVSIDNLIEQHARQKQQLRRR